MWGADAGGVILMSTTDARSKTGVEGFLEAGGDDFYQAALSGLIATDSRASLSVGQLETDGINARNIDTIVADGTAMKTPQPTAPWPTSLTKRSLWRWLPPNLR